MQFTVHYRDIKAPSQKTLSSNKISVRIYYLVWLRHKKFKGLFHKEYLLLVHLSIYRD